MNSNKKKSRALGLCSGGLDSILSALVLRQAGVEVEWITFETPFFSSEKAKKAARMTGIPITVRNIFPDYMEMLQNPPCGYGKHMNPCMDCHALMFRLAGEEMKTQKFDFLFSGEVLGQRPMSQTRPSLRYVEKHSGFDGHILRPLSAGRLPETIPEKEGLVSRESLLSLTGRSRKPQIELAKKYGVTDYPAPAGGCLLTDKGYSARLKDLFERQDRFTEEELRLLKYGRHFRISDGMKIIVGRSRGDNRNMERLRDPDRDILLKTETVPGPVALLRGDEKDMDIDFAASICVGYSKAPAGSVQPVRVSLPEGKSRTVMAKGISPGEVRNRMIL
ncbi:tRNA 4-thiouridine(8) synthase ThiI [Candidatus Desulfarcum epimagneticum]|uniref:tRNA 4-thiouridine(8) synthase ThiI n=1 Tax=uncultured Desulfobacteraceae bacterium TaxID=218296 RepID=A0A484HJM9_9BACT|nr:tRNA 4-thiouridine(8) synthase ThiI [uncultured Desulfobacteraceae bacterium]